MNGAKAWLKILIVLGLLRWGEAQRKIPLKIEIQPLCRGVETIVTGGWKEEPGRKLKKKRKTKKRKA
jgi:hypothetical protein